MNSPARARNQKSTSYTTVMTRDLISIGLLGTILLCLHNLGDPFRRGFQCDDETIRYPYKDSTVSSGACYSIGSGINLILIIVLEYLVVAYAGNLSNINQQNDAQNSGQEFKTKLYIRNVYCRFLVWLFGAIVSEFLTDVTKINAGRLRPHFIDICKPIVNVNGTELSLDAYCQHYENRYLYITNYNCTGPPAKQRDARLSFLSGHSSYSAYSAGFAVFYLQAAFDGVKFGLVKPALQVLIISAAFYVGLSRISDYKHHWSDVLAGLTLGTLVAALMLKCVWPPISKAYNLCSKVRPRVQGDANGEELNRVSY